MAVLSRAGCNMGVCHGNANGKNGFRLSLRGDDPDFDYRALTRDTHGRRVNSNDPESSLVLLKASGSIPHEGGRRFGRDSLEYALLRNWIAAGFPRDAKQAPRLLGIRVTPAEAVLYAPKDTLDLKVEARFTDGQTRDVTGLAVFEPSNGLVQVTADGSAKRLGDGETTIVVRYLNARTTVALAFVPERPGYRPQPRPEANYIDRLVFAKLDRLRIQPAEVCKDEIFIRRAYLDALGILPSVAETRRFLADAGAAKRVRLVEELLRRPEFADFWALKWSDLLRNEEKTLDRRGVQVFHQWLRNSFLSGKPLDVLARELLTAEGSTYQNPPANFYRALRDPQIRAETAAQVFLGIRIQCARCHNHPFDVWTQNDYYGLAACFARVDYRLLNNKRQDRLDTHEFDGEQIVFQHSQGELKHPARKSYVSPRVLGPAGKTTSASTDRLRWLAEWLTRPDNPYFAKAQANRIWFHLLGRGLVEPNDDFRATNPPAHVGLLEVLARDLAFHHFDVRHLVRTIMTSTVYQLAATPNETNVDDEANFSRALVRPLQAEVLLDALGQATEAPARFPGQPRTLRAAQLPGVGANQGRIFQPSAAEVFLRRFGKPERLLTCECERSGDSTLHQAFQLITGSTLHQMLSSDQNRIGRLLSAGTAGGDILNEIFLAGLCRPPTPAESTALLRLVESAPDRRRAWEDVLWGVLNSKEFLLRH